MKFRQCFVSNSSSSSFVLIGFKANDIYEFAEGEYEEITKTKGLGHVFFKDNLWIGELLAKKEEDFWESIEYSFEKLEQIKQKIIEKYPDKDVKLLIGEQAT